MEYHVESDDAMRFELGLKFQNPLLKFDEQYRLRGLEMMYIFEGFHHNTMSRDPKQENFRVKSLQLFNFDKQNCY